MLFDSASNLIVKLALLLGSLALTEVGLQLGASISSDWAPALQRVTEYRSDQNTYWKLKFLDNLENSPSVTGELGKPLLEIDPVLGWVPKANLNLVNEDGQRITTNGDGFRAGHDYEHSPDKLNILVIGDSFTFGSDADDGSVWPTILQNRRSEWNVINLAVPAYGTDQMLILLRQYISTYKPDIVIAAFISDDLNRAMLNFRTYHKPRFVLENGMLQSVSTEIPTVEKTIEALRQELDHGSIFYRVKLIGLLSNATHWIKKIYRETLTKERSKLNLRLFEEMKLTADGHQAKFIAIYLPNHLDVSHPKSVSYGEVFLNHLKADTDIFTINPRPEFLTRYPSYSGGHYKLRGATIIADTVDRAVNEKFSEPY